MQLNSLTGLSITKSLWSVAAFQLHSDKKAAAVLERQLWKDITVIYNIRLFYL